MHNWFVLTHFKFHQIYTCLTFFFKLPNIIIIIIFFFVMLNFKLIKTRKMIFNKMTLSYLRNTGPGFFKWLGTGK